MIVKRPRLTPKKKKRRKKSLVGSTPDPDTDIDAQPNSYSDHDHYHCHLLIQCPSLNRIPLAQHKSENNNRMIQSAKIFCVLLKHCVTIRSQ